MKIVAIGLINFSSKLKPMIDEEFKRFVASSPFFQVLENAIVRVRALGPEAGPSPYEAAIQKLIQFKDYVTRAVSSGSRFEEEEIEGMDNRIMELKNILDEQTSSAFMDDRMKAMHILKLERQIHWLSWYEDMLCELIEGELNFARVRQRADTAYIVLMPELMFTDIKQNKKHDIPFTKEHI